jgi:hypothetical protein
VIGTNNHTGGSTWERLEVSGALSGGESAMVLAIRDASGFPADSYYVDGVQVEEKAYSTTYCDGDQDGCEWTGAEHASTSTRDALSRAGGRVKDFDDDYSFPIERMVGTGAAPMENVIAERVYTPGGNYERTVVLSRVFSLVSTAIGSTLSDYHDKRQALFNVLAPDTFDNEPFTLRYTGATVDKQIRARYSGGMTLSKATGFHEPVALQFVAADPMFEQIGETGAGAVATRQAVLTRYVAGRVDGAWSALGPPDASGTYNEVSAVEAGYDGTIYFGGDFTNFDNQGGNFNYIVSWDGSSYSALGSGMNGVVNALKLKPDGNLLAGGAFTTAGGVTCRGIAEWNGSAWSALGPPSSGGTVNAIEIGSDGAIYVGGTFTNWDGTANADGIASWDGSAWSALGTGITGGSANVEAILEGDDGILYVGGDYTTAGGSAADSIASWDGSAWTSLSSSTNLVINSLISFGGEIIAGGNFTTLNGASISIVGGWNGVGWRELSTLAGNIREFIIWRGNLTAVGTFTAIAGLDWIQGVALWGGSSWTYLDIDLGAAVSYGGTVFNDDIYLGTGSSVTAEWAGATSITPGGNARTYPVITITRSGGTLARLQNIINETTKAYIYSGFELQDGETVTIDLRPGLATFVSSYYGNIAGFFQGSAINEFYLLPNVANDIKMLVTITGAPTITANIKWVEQYWSVD